MSRGRASFRGLAELRPSLTAVEAGNPRPTAYGGRVGRAPGVARNTVVSRGIAIGKLRDQKLLESGRRPGLDVGEVHASFDIPDAGSGRDRPPVRVPTPGWS